MHRQTHIYLDCKISPRNATTMGVELGVASLETPVGRQAQATTLHWAISGLSWEAAAGKVSKRHLPGTPFESIIFLRARLHQPCGPQARPQVGTSAYIKDISKGVLVSPVHRPDFYYIIKSGHCRTPRVGTSKFLYKHINRKLLRSYEIPYHFVSPPFRAQTLRPKLSK